MSEEATTFDVNAPHFHVCPKCRHIWSHTVAQSVIAGQRKSHRCSECKSAQGGMGWLSMRAAENERAALAARDTVAEAIRGEPMAGEPRWELLAEDRKNAWRADADRALTALALARVHGEAEAGKDE